MTPLSIIGVFCEDIRIEMGDIITLIGLLPDNIDIQPTHTEKGGVATNDSKFLPKLCVYARANFDPDDPVNEINLRLILPDEKEVPFGGASPDVIKLAKQQAKERGNPLAGVMMRGVMSPFQMSGGGILRLEAIIGSEVRLISHLNFKVYEKTSSSSASGQPSEQSPTAAP